MGSSIDNHYNLNTKMNKKLAPIVLFTYNRPWHTKQLLDSLALNAEAKDSILYIYCDGIKDGESITSIHKIQETRRIAKAENRFQKVFVQEQINNKGLANSIIDGVTEIVNIYESVIILEDDLVLSKYFLYYMNDSLVRYKENKNVGQIGACNFFACGDNFPNAFFIPMPDCLGWATWKNRWDYFIPDSQLLLEQLKKNNLEYNFNAYGSYNMIGMLKSQIKGEVNSWAIRWQAICILNNWLILYPNPSLSNHIESTEATHESSNIIPPLCKTKPNLESIDIVENSKVIKAMKKGYSGNGNYYGKYKREYKISKLKNIIRLFDPNRYIIRLSKYKTAIIKSLMSAKN